jgi:hypothetical protein
VHTYAAAIGARGLAGMGSAAPSRGDSPRRSGSQASLAFDALVMAATGGTDGAAAAAAGGEAAVDSRLGSVSGLGNGAVAAAAAVVAAAAAAASAQRASAGGGGASSHQLAARQRSRLWGALSYGGDVDSLQNALDAFRVRTAV